MKTAQKNSSYKMSKETKRMLALGKYDNETHRAEWKRAMMAAEQVVLISAKTPKAGNEKDPVTGLL
jgi:hypothetical protein